MSRLHPPTFDAIQRQDWLRDTTLEEICDFLTFLAGAMVTAHQLGANMLVYNMLPADFAQSQRDAQNLTQEPTTRRGKLGSCRSPGLTQPYLG